MRLRWDGRSLRDAQHAGEALLVIVVTWLLLGQYLDNAITQVDGALFQAPFTRSALEAGFDWTDHLYRFGVMGGSPMHDYAGTLPLVQLCSAIGLSTTATLNAITIFLQLCFGFFGLKTIEAIGTVWSPVPVRLALPERIASVWLCSFAPVLGWRLALGHETIVEGLLPMLVGASLLWLAKAQRLSAFALAFGFFAVWSGVSRLGAQLVLYSLIVGGPYLVALLLTSPPRRRDAAIVTAVVVGGVLVALPRVAGMLEYTSHDAGRALGDALTYSLGPARAEHWWSSLAWTRETTGGVLAHEQNYPVGPLLVLLVVLWPRGKGRAVAATLAVGAVLAILFASDVAPVSTIVLQVPLVESFRIPARAILPLLVLLPSHALALFWIAREQARASTPDHARSRLLAWLAIAIATALIALHGRLGSWPREVIAWLGCIGLAGIARWWPHLLQRYVLACVVVLVAGLGVLAFDERLVRNAPREPIEGAPQQLRTAVLEEAPDLAMPLNRIQVLDAPPPYAMALGFAAGLGTIDGDFNPPRRFLTLLGALRGKPLAAATVVFTLGHSPMFPVLQQLYNIRYAISFENGAPTFVELPPPPGAAWLPARVETLDSPDAIALALKQDARSTAYLLRADGAITSTTCKGHVLGVETDRLGQRATIDVETQTACTLVVATNYVRSLRATAGGRTLAVFPIDIALTGIAVPPGRTLVMLAPVAHVSWWSRAASLIGYALLAGALVLSRRQASE